MDSLPARTLRNQDRVLGFCAPLFAPVAGSMFLVGPFFISSIPGAVLWIGLGVMLLFIVSMLCIGVWSIHVGERAKKIGFRACKECGYHMVDGGTSCPECGSDYDEAEAIEYWKQLLR